MAEALLSLQRTNRINVNMFTLAVLRTTVQHSYEYRIHIMEYRSLYPIMR
jgi:hypothetical protein